MGIKARFAQDIVVYNRIPKTGGTSFSKLFRITAQENGATQFAAMNYYWKKLDTTKQKRKFVDYVFGKKRPLLYNREIHFLDFSEYTNTLPRWISNVRDPVKRFISRFAFARQLTNQFDFKTFHKTEPDSVGNLTKLQWLKKDLNACIVESDPECYFKEGSFRDFFIPYFCGHEDECQRYGSQWAMQRAKANVERHYDMVGLLEDPKKSCIVLEGVNPTMFGGCEKNFARTFSVLNPGRRKSMYNVTEEAKAVLRDRLAVEYEFYEYLKARLDKQYKDVIEGKRKV